MSVKLPYSPSRVALVEASSALIEAALHHGSSYGSSTSSKYKAVIKMAY